jgi:D-beta-D-heptose 7-phosphate kinase/D-beta-D-heptose 1-phosphate adenosyltransferase
LTFFIAVILSIWKLQKKYGDTLIVGLNSDKSVSKLKGEDRPINSETDRAYILASIAAVDYVVIFNEKNPYELIKFIMPHTLVKGGDYKRSEVIGNDLVNEVKLIDFVDGKSTSNTIKKILEINKNERCN